MSILGGTIQTGDWKGEKHVPVIEAPASAQAGEVFEVKYFVGKEIAHPNTLEHHISWIKLFFVPEGGKPVELADSHFSAHGELDSFDEPCSLAKIKLQKSGKLVALSYCNIHGLWENSVDIKIG